MPKAHAPKAQARDVRDRLKAWLLEAAFPLWADRGVDRVHGGFYEKIGQDGAPVAAPRRIRVAARQAVSFAAAGRLGWTGPWREVVDHGLKALQAYARDDGLYGVLASPEGELLDAAPHPYEQAFVMLALAAGPDEAGAVRAREALRARYGRPDGGFFDEAPPAGPLRANPHMHLFEAALAWAGAGTDPGWRAMAEGIGALALAKMIEPATGALCELFDADWRPLAGADVEPGHQFEWAWLLLKSGAPPEPALRLIDLAETHGVDGRGVAFNALDRNLAPRDRTARLWPQTERIKAGVAAALATGEDRYWDLAARGGEGLLKYLQTPVRGLWLDRMREDGSFIDEPAPASSFYHIVGAVADLDAGLDPSP